MPLRGCSEYLCEHPIQLDHSTRVVPLDADNQDALLCRYQQRSQHYQQAF